MNNVLCPGGRSDHVKFKVKLLIDGFFPFLLAMKYRLLDVYIKKISFLSSSFATSGVKFWPSDPIFTFFNEIRDKT